MPAVYRILIADDDPEQLEVFRALLQHSGYVVELALSAAESLARIAAACPDVFLMDLCLPTSSDGRALIRAVRDAGCSRPIIVLSGWPADLYTTPEERLVSHILMKPVPVPTLLTTLAYLLAPES